MTGFGVGISPRIVVGSDGLSGLLRPSRATINKPLTTMIAMYVIASCFCCDTFQCQIAEPNANIPAHVVGSLSLCRKYAPRRVQKFILRRQGEQRVDFVAQERRQPIDIFLRCALQRQRVVDDG